MVDPLLHAEFLFAIGSRTLTLLPPREGKVGMGVMKVQGEGILGRLLCLASISKICLNLAII